MSNKGKSNSPWLSPLMISLVLTSPSLPLTASSASTAPPPLPASPISPPQPPSSTLKPSMAVIVGVLTTMFSLTFLLLLYAKHCRRTHHGYPPGRELVTVVSSDRKNSGVDRTIIESLPVFRFGSLSGQKDGLECAVCLTRFDPSEVLRLLPKCKHAFHVECVDTWLDSHSTCPLCRYRVEPEDIFLVLDSHEVTEEKEAAVRRVSGRHSSAGEKGSGLLQISVDTSPLPAAAMVSGSRRSLDSASSKKKSAKRTKKKGETTSSSMDRHRKDGLLLADAVEEEEKRRRCEHRIIVGAQRWSDVQPSDLLYLRSEMILSEGRRLKGSRPSIWNERNNGWWQRQQQSGKSVINARSVSEIIGLSRFRSNDQAGVLLR